MRIIFGTGRAVGARGARSPAGYRRQAVAGDKCCRPHLNELLAHSTSAALLLPPEGRQKTSPEHLEAPARVPQVDDLLDFIFSVSRGAPRWR